MMLLDDSTKTFGRSRYLDELPNGDHDDNDPVELIDKFRLSAPMGAKVIVTFVFKTEFPASSLNRHKEMFKKLSEATMAVNEIIEMQNDRKPIDAGAKLLDWIDNLGIKKKYHEIDIFLKAIARRSCKIKASILGSAVVASRHFKKHLIFRDDFVKAIRSDVEKEIGQQEAKVFFDKYQ